MQGQSDPGLLEAEKEPRRPPRGRRWSRPVLTLKAGSGEHTQAGRVAVTTVSREVERKTWKGRSKGGRDEQRERGRKSRLPSRKPQGHQRPAEPTLSEEPGGRSPRTPAGRPPPAEGRAACGPGSSTSAGAGAQRRPPTRSPRPGDPPAIRAATPRNRVGAPGRAERRAAEHPSPLGPANPLERPCVLLDQDPVPATRRSRWRAPQSGSRTHELQEEGAELAGETEQEAGASALADVDGNLLKSFRTVAFVARMQKKCKQIECVFIILSGLHSLFTQQVPGEHPLVTEVCH